MPPRRVLAACAAISAALTIAACGARRIELPSGAGAPAPEAATAYTDAIEACRGARTIRATLSLSGRAGSEKLRGDIDSGFAAPDSVRLEGRHPFGRPVFILAGTAPRATLVLPRDERVLRGVGAEAIVEALVGLPLGPSELRTIVSGCGFGPAEPGGGRSYSNGWTAVDAGGATNYLRRIDGRWRLVAAARPPLTVFYGGFASSRPSTVRIQSRGPVPADISVRLSDVSINLPFEAEVFDVEAPAGAVPLTLDELRRAGPLGVQ